MLTTIDQLRHSLIGYEKISSVLFDPEMQKEIGKTEQDLVLNADGILRKYKAKGLANSPLYGLYLRDTMFAIAKYSGVGMDEKALSNFMYLGLQLGCLMIAGGQGGFKA